MLSMRQQRISIDIMIKAIFSASPTNMTMAQALQWDYNPSLISIPVFFVSSMGNGDENLVVSGTQLQEIFDAVPDTVTKVMARRTDAEHGDMLSVADGYMTAWRECHFHLLFLYLSL